MTNVSNTVGELAPESGLRPYAYSEEVITISDEELEKFLETSALEYLIDQPSFTGERNGVTEAETEVELEQPKVRTDLAKQALKQPKVSRKSRKAQKSEENTKNDSRFKNALKSTWEKTPRSGKVIGALGALAVTATSFLAPLAQGIEKYVDGQKVVTAAAVGVENSPVTYEGVDTSTTYFPIGGAGQGGAPPVGEMVDGGYVNGMVIDPIFYSSSIGPFVGTESMVQSEQGGVNYALPRVLNAIDRGQNVNIPAFSEGTGVQKELAWAIYDHYGYWPDGLTLTQLGGPYHPGGVFDSKFTRAANSPLMPALDMFGIDSDRALPPGVKIEYDYFADDPWAGNGNENFMTYLKNFAGLAVGDHAIPNENDPNVHIVVITDKEGNLHKIFVRNQDVFIQAIQKAGIQVMDPDDATAAINAFFPENIDPNSTTPPKADVRAGMAFAAKAIDRQIDPSGNVQIFEKMVDNMPESWKVLLEDGWNGINNTMDKVADAMNNPGDPVKMMAAFQAVMQEIGTITGDFSAVMQNPTGDIKNLMATTAADQVQISTGMDMHAEFQSFADMLFQPTPQGQAAANSWANPVPPQVTVSATVNTQTPSITITAPTIPQVTQNLNQIIPSNITDIPKSVFNGGNIPTSTPATSTFEPAPIQITLPKPAPEVVVTPEYTPPPAPVYEAPAAPVYEAPKVIPPAPAPVEAPAPAPAPVVVDIPPAPAPVEAPAPAPAPITIPEIFAPAPAPAPAPALTFDFKPAPAPISAPTSIPSVVSVLAPAPTTPADS